MLDELHQYLVTNDIKVLKKLPEKLYVCKFLSRLNSQLKPLRGQLLAGEGGPLSAKYFLTTISDLEYFTATFDPSQIEVSTLIFSTVLGNTSRVHGGMSFRDHGLSTGGRFFGRGQDYFQKYNMYQLHY